MLSASTFSCPVHAAAPRYSAPTRPGTVFSSSMPTTSATSWNPARSSATAPSTAALPDAHAASCRDAGTPHSSSFTVAGIAPR